MATFTEDFSRMRQGFDEAQADRQQLLEETHEHVRQMAHGVQEQLGGFRQELHQMRGEIAEVADRVRTELGKFGTDLRNGGRIFRGESKPR